MSSAVYALPRAEVRTPAGRRSVPGMSSVIARLGSSADERGDCVVAMGGLTQGATSGGGQRPSPGGQTGRQHRLRFQWDPQSDRVNTLLRFQEGRGEG